MTSTNKFYFNFWSQTLWLNRKNAAQFSRQFFFFEISHEAKKKETERNGLEILEQYRVNNVITHENKFWPWLNRSIHPALITVIKPLHTVIGWRARESWRFHFIFEEECEWKTKTKWHPCLRTVWIRRITVHKQSTYSRDTELVFVLLFYRAHGRDTYHLPFVLCAFVK